MTDLLTGGTLSVGAAAPDFKGEEVFHPDAFFTDPSYAAYDLRRLAAQFDTWQRGRAKPPKAPTRRKYQYSLDALFRTMDCLELRYLHPVAVECWISAARAKGQSEDGLASTLASIKGFANGYVYRQLELTLNDPLRKVPRITPPEREMPVLDDSELAKVLACFDEDYEGIRNRAFVAVLMGTGCRLRECRELTMQSYDPIACELTIHGKGDRLRYAGLSPRVAAYLKAYLKVRPKRMSGDLWLTRGALPMSEGAWVSVLRRTKKRSGVPRVHAHLLRHTFGSYAIDHGAERAAVQDMLGHESDYMTRRYTRAARKRTAAAMMPLYSPV